MTYKNGWEVKRFQSISIPVYSSSNCARDSEARPISMEVLKVGSLA